MFKFKVHGKYCGPGYCGGTYESPCDYSVRPDDEVDEICREHDRAYESESNSQRRQADYTAAERLRHFNSPRALLIRAALRHQGTVRGLLASEPEDVPKQDLLPRAPASGRSRYQAPNMSMKKVFDVKRQGIGATNPTGQMTAGRPSVQVGREPSRVHQYGLPTASDYLQLTGDGTNNPVVFGDFASLPMTSPTPAYGIDFLGKYKDQRFVMASIPGAYPYTSPNQTTLATCWKIESGGWADFDATLAFTMYAKSSDFSGSLYAGTFVMQIQLVGYSDISPSGPAATQVYQDWTQYISCVSSGAGVIAGVSVRTIQVTTSINGHILMNTAAPYMVLRLLKMSILDQNGNAVTFPTGGSNVIQIFDLCFRETIHSIA